MTKKLLPALLLAALCALPCAQAREVAGVRLPDQVQAAQPLQLNGAGLRSKLVFKVYAIGLYLPQKTTSAAEVLGGSGPRRVLLAMLREVDGDTLLSALREGLHDNPGDTALAPASLEALERIFRAVGKTHEGDLIALDITSDGLAVTINGAARGNVADPVLARALLRVWLGEKPIDAALKRALLGG